jgi:two-component system, OmpR family, sensor histidine kinase CreC
MSLRLRLLLVILAVYAAGGYFLTRWMLDQVRPRYLESMEESLVDMSVVLAAFLEQHVSEKGVDPASLRVAFERASARAFEAKIFSLTKTQIDLRIYVVDGRGIVLFDSQKGNEGGDFSRWNDVGRALAGRYGARSTRDVPGNDATQVLYVAAPIRFQNEIVGAVSVGKPTQGINALVTVARQRILAGAALGGAALLLLLLLGASWIMTPLEKLTRYARDVRDGRPATLPNLPGRTLSELAQAFEQMRDALAGRQHAERYTQALAHEVKAPLTAIRGAAELLDEEMPAEQRRRFLSNVRTETNRIQRIIERLLELTSVEARKALHQTESIASAELLAEAAQAVRSAYEARRITLTSRDDADFTVVGERFLLRQALVNLLQNALDFSVADNEVVLCARVSGDRYEFVVRDHGPGVPEYALPRVFERFYSLSRPATGQKSTGIGLALVREIARLHGGDAMLVNVEGKGAEATIWIPRSSVI